VDVPEGRAYVKWYQSQENFFAFCSREEGNSPCRQGDGIDSHPIQRKEKTRGEGVGKAESRNGKRDT
jgi:hypothetical protein